MIVILIIIRMMMRMRMVIRMMMMMMMNSVKCNKIPMYPWQISGMASSKAQTQEQHLILIATAKNIEKSIVLKLRSRPF